MMKYLSFLGASFICLIAFGLVNYYHLHLEKTRPGSLIGRIAFLLVFPLGLFALPAIVISYPARKLSDRQLEDSIKQEEYKKHQALIAIPNRLLQEAQAKINRYEKLIEDDRIRCHKEGYQKGRKLGFEEGYMLGHRSGSEFTMSVLLCPEDQRPAIRLSVYKAAVKYINEKRAAPSEDEQTATGTPTPER